MTTSMKRMKLAIAVSIITMAFGACSSKIHKSDIAATANPVDEIARLDSSIQESVKQHVDVLAPEEFEKASEYVKEAKSDLNNKKDQSEIIENISYATSYLNKGRATADSRRGTIEGVLAARTAAIEAGVNNYQSERDQFDKLGKELKSASSNFKKNLTPDDISRLQRDFMNLEVASISARELGSARAKISGSIDGGAKKRTPNTLSQAQIDLRSAENVLNQNSKNPSAYKAAMDKANTSAQFLVVVLAEAKRNGKNTSESVAIQLAQKNQKIGNLQSTLGESQDNAQALGKTVARQGQMVSLQQAIEKARKEFTKDEAEVFQQDNNLLIRLKTMNFSTGRADLPQESLDILAKVHSVIGSLDASKVVVEGHTDSTGNAAVNQKISQERADAVAKYLETSGTDVKDISAVGFGYKKPLATNKDKTGRAQNRRVDVIVTVAKNKTASVE